MDVVQAEEEGDSAEEEEEDFNVMKALPPRLLVSKLRLDGFRFRWALASLYLISVWSLFNK